MNIHLLVTVSEDASALYGIRFITGFFGEKAGVKVTLFYTAPQPSAVWAEERNYESLNQSEQQAMAIEKKGRNALNQAQAKLLEAGFKKDNVQTKLMFRQNTKANDILQESEKGLYDAVVLGRRGLSKLEEALLDTSVSRELLCEQSVAPLWVCREPDISRKNVLICVDGSEPAYRMVDHIGFVLAQEKEHKITLLYLEKREERAKTKADSIFSHCRTLLEENNYPLEMVSTRTLTTKDMVKTIVQEASSGKYAAVGVGRSGSGGCSLRNIFMGSVSYGLFREITGASLWVCQ